MHAHLSAQDDDMWFVMTDEPMNIMKANTAMDITAGAPQWIEKTRMEYTPEDKKKVMDLCKQIQILVLSYTKLVVMLLMFLLSVQMLAGNEQ
ncbi:hypothetical protein F511_46172 [Dorcoceras hygrometricum]|uniref:Uncharacterized protein n=1 Tax=Dorcoceras hygrometricum TaxID=472368 RepID=A0A2Z7A176_9LAMI|nr:hypothetical protein F511_46172 [Dorcoceras hygrometricum]